MKKNLLGFYLLIFASFISWVITIWSVSFTYFPADSLYFSKNLPLSYWFGVALAIMATVFSIFKSLTKKYANLLPQMILLLYLHGLPAFTYENMQFYDTYQHASSALYIYHSGGLQVMDTYAKEYPGVFSFLAQLLQLQRGSFSFLTVFLRFHSLLILILSIILVYIIANKFSPRYSPLACFAFLSVMWVEYPHFSPQAYAFILYLIFLFVIVKVLVDRERSRSWTIVLFLSIFAIAISHPTTPLFLFLSIASALYIIPMFFKGPDSGTMKFMHFNGTLTLLMFVVIWMGWTAFMGQEFVLGYGVSMVIQSIKSFGQLQELSVPINPQMTYFISVTLRELITVYVALSGFLILVFLRNRKKIRASLLPLAGGFIGSFFAAPLFLFWGTAAMLPRVLLFSVVPWCVLIAICTDLTGVRRLSKVVLLACIVIFALLMPISKYGAEPFTYIPSSVSSSAVFLVANSQTRFLILIKLTPEDPPSHIYKFYASLYGKEVQILGYRRNFSRSLIEGNISETIRMMEPNAPVVFTSTYENALLLRRNTLSPIKEIEETVSYSFSLIYDSGSARIYRK